MRRFQTTSGRAVTAVAFDPTSAFLVACGSGGFDVWDLGSDARRNIPFPASRYLYTFGFDPRGRFLWLSMGGPGLRFYEWPALDSRPLPGDKYENHVLSLSVSPHGDRFAMCRGGVLPDAGDGFSRGVEGTAGAVPPAVEQTQHFHQFRRDAHGFRGGLHPAAEFA